MNNFGPNLKKLRTARNLTQGDLSEEFNISRSAVSMYENGEREPDFETLEMIADYFNVDMNHLLGDVKPLKVSTGRKIPLIGTIAAGTPIEAIENIEDYFNIDSKIKADYALRIKGDSMINVNILDGDIVFIRKQSCVDNGEIGAILVDGEATLKRFYKMDGHVVLQAENPNYQPMIVEYGEVIVLGKMVASLREYK